MINKTRLVILLIGVLMILAAVLLMDDTEKAGMVAVLGLIIALFHPLIDLMLKSHND